MSAAADSPEMGCIEPIGSGEGPDNMLGHSDVSIIPSDEESEDEVEDGADSAPFIQILFSHRCSCTRRHATEGSR